MIAYVLEIGTGSGYQSALLGEIVSSVYTLEIDELLSQKARQTLRALGYFNVLVKCSDGYLGWPQKSPFDAVILSACPRIIQVRELVRQLKPGGRMILPFGEEDQVLLVLEKDQGRDCLARAGWSQICKDEKPSLIGFIVRM